MENEVKQFSRKHITEILIAAALVVGAISSWTHYFFGANLTIGLFTIGAIVGIFFPSQIEIGMKWFYGFIAKRGRVMQIVMGAIHIAIGLFIPFILFGLFGMLAGTAYHYFTGRALRSEGSSKHHHAA